MANKETEDAWMLPGAAAPPMPNPPALIRKHIGHVEPLGVLPMADDGPNVPGALDDILFGPQDLEASSSHSNVPLFALLDAARIMGLPERLDASVLEHACLFKGRAQEDLGDVAPWLVKLDRDHPLTRGLFSEGTAPWHLWQTGTYILMRSSASLPSLVTHLRRFTGFRDEDGKWLYFRFCDPALLHLYLDASDANCRAGLFGMPNGPSIAQIIYTLGTDWFALSHPPFEGAEARIDKAAVRQIAMLAAADRELAELTAKGALEASPVPTERHKQIARDTVLSVYGAGFKSRYHLRYFIAWALVYAGELDPLRGDIQTHLHDTHTSVEIRFQAISELIRARLGQRMGALFA
ncbi:MAG: DUF4123 domain-containing protein [Pseudomonadota bacterium]